MRQITRILALTLLGFSTPAGAGHVPELSNVGREAQAECIAIMLRNVPRRDWLPAARKHAREIGLCRRVLGNPYMHDFPMKGAGWMERLDVGRRVERERKD